MSPLRLTSLGETGLQVDKLASHIRQASPIGTGASGAQLCRRRDRPWAADVTLIRPPPGFLYLAVSHHGRLESPDRGLVDSDPPADRARAGGLGHGLEPASARTRVHHSDQST